MAKSKRNYPVDEGTAPKSERPQRDVDTSIDPGYPVIFYTEDVNARTSWKAQVPAISLTIDTGEVGYRDWRELMNIVTNALYEVSCGRTPANVVELPSPVKTSGKVMVRQCPDGPIMQDALARRIATS